MAAKAVNDKTNDSTFRYFVSLGDRLKFIHIYIGQNPEANTIKLRITTFLLIAIMNMFE